MLTNFQGPSSKSLSYMYLANKIPYRPIGLQCTDRKKGRNSGNKCYRKQKIQFHLFSILIPHIKFQDTVSMQNVLNVRTDERMTQRNALQMSTHKICFLRKNNNTTIPSLIWSLCNICEQWTIFNY